MYTLVYIRNKELRLAYTLVINQLDYFYHGGEDPTWSSYYPVLSGGSLKSGLHDVTIGIAKHEIKYYQYLFETYGSRYD